MAGASMTTTGTGTWDYSALAVHYDKRADYAGEALDQLLERARPGRARPIADVGAGTGKLTRPLLDRGFAVHAVEPNDAMRGFGVANTAGRPATWSVGTGEATGLSSAAYDLVTFGSSFNVTDRAKTLVEVARILRPRGWFACMWNHRDLADPIQTTCEAVIKRYLPDYGYGSRREDQAAVIRASDLFEEPIAIEGLTINRTPLAEFIDAWRSHATLERQAGGLFGEIVAAIERELAGRAFLDVPYTTRLWCARRNA